MTKEEKVSTSAKILTKNEIVDLAKRVLTEDLASMMKQTAEKYDELAQEKAQNEIYNANQEIARNFPESGVLSVLLTNGEMTLPYKKDTTIKFTCSQNGEKTILEYNVNEITDLDIFNVVSELVEQGSRILEIETYSPQNVTMYNQEVFDKEQKVETEIRVYERTYYGITLTDNIMGIYKVTGKFK